MAAISTIWFCGHEKEEAERCTSNWVGLTGWARLLFLVSLLLLCREVSGDASLEQYNNCIRLSSEAALHSCEAYVEAGGRLASAYVRLAELYKERGDFQKSKAVYEKALKLKKTETLSERIKSADSLIDEKEWIEDRETGAQSKGDGSTTASLGEDRVKCLRLSDIKPEIAYDACVRYTQASSEVDEKIERALATAREALGKPPREEGDSNRRDERPKQQRYDHDLVVQSQRLLNELGYRVGPEDGIFGPKTSNAISEFQQRNNMEVTGELNTGLLDRLALTAARRKMQEKERTASREESSGTAEAAPADSTAEELAELRQQIAQLSQLITTEASNRSDSTKTETQYREKGDRKALVIGNWDYKTGLPSLRNPSNDAKDLSQMLRSLGFKVTTVYNGSLRDIEMAISDFSDSLEVEDKALFYYAGHGVQIEGQNYLIPTNVRVEDAIDIKYKSVDLSYVLAKINRRNSGLTIVILDACRNNPFTSDRGVAQSGWATVKGGAGSIIAYATAPGEVARDGTGENGLYTKYLLKMMKQPGLKIEEMFKRVRVAVKKESNGQQIPWENSAMTGDFYFVPPGS